MSDRAGERQGLGLVATGPQQRARRRHGRDRSANRLSGSTQTLSGAPPWRRGLPESAGRAGRPWLTAPTRTAAARRGSDAPLRARPAGPASAAPPVRIGGARAVPCRPAGVPDVDAARLGVPVRDERCPVRVGTGRARPAAQGAPAVAVASAARKRCWTTRSGRSGKGSWARRHSAPATIAGSGTSLRPECGANLQEAGRDRGTGGLHRRHA